MTQIAIRSKSYWRYSPDLIEAWKEDLTDTPEFIKNGIGYVAELVSTVGFEVSQIKAYIKKQEQLDTTGSDENGSF